MPGGLERSLGPVCERVSVCVHMYVYMLVYVYMFVCVDLLAPELLIIINYH